MSKWPNNLDENIIQVRLAHNPNEATEQSLAFSTNRQECTKKARRDHWPDWRRTLRVTSRDIRRLQSEGGSTGLNQPLTSLRLESCLLASRAQSAAHRGRRPPHAPHLATGLAQSAEPPDSSMRVNEDVAVVSLREAARCSSIASSRFTTSRRRFYRHFTLVLYDN